MPTDTTESRSYIVVLRVVEIICYNQRMKRMLKIVLVIVCIVLSYLALSRFPQVNWMLAMRCMTTIVLWIVTIVLWWLAWSLKERGGNWMLIIVLWIVAIVFLVLAVWRSPDIGPV